MKEGINKSIFRPHKIGFYLLTIAVVLAFLFLSVANYNFNTHTMSTLTQAKDNYGRTTIQQTSELIENQFSLLSSVTPSLVNTHFPENVLSQLSKHDHQSEALFLNNARNMLLSLKAVNSQVTDVILFTEEGSRCYGDQQSFYGITAEDVECHWNLNPDSEATLVFPGANTYSNNKELNSLTKNPLVFVPVRKNNEQPVYFGIVLSEFYFSQTCGAYSDFAIISHGSEVIHNNTSFSTEELLSLLNYPEKQDDDTSMLYEAVLSNQLILLHAYDSQSLKTPLTSISTKVFLLDSLLLLISVVIAGTFSKRIIMPFQTAVENISSYPSVSNTPKTDIRRYSRMSIREQIFSYFLMIILPVFLTFSISSIYFYRTFTTDTHRNLIQRSFLQTSNDIQHFFDNTHSTAMAITLENAVQQQSIGTSIGWRPTNMQFFDGRVNIGLYDQDGQAVYLSDVHSFSDEYLQENERPSVQSWTVAWKNETSYIQFIVPYRTPNTLDLIGYLVCRIEQPTLVDIYSNLYHTTGDAFLIDSNDIIVSHKLLSVQNHATKDQQISQVAGSRDLVFTQHITGTPYTFVLCGNTSQLQESQRAFLIDTLYLCLGVLAVSLLLSYVLSNVISKYFVETCRRFYDYVPDISKLTEPKPSLIDEINQINSSFNEMTSRINKLNSEAVKAAKRELQLELDSRQRELALLQAQINPHFLSNTFENINYFIRNDEPGKAIQTLNTLSDMFSYAVREKRRFVPLQHEIDYVKRYVDIMQIRFPNVFSVSYEISEEFLFCQVPCFFLQPIVENAITHALLPKGTGGQLKISCMGTGDRLYLVIKDNGVGIDQDKLRIITERLSTEEESRSIGLYNTHHLLQKSFGDPYGLNISSQKDVGTTVVLTLPRSLQ